MKKNKEQEIISMCASLLLAIFLTVLSLLLSIKIGFTSINSISKIMDKTNYYEVSYEELMDNCESLAIPYGLSKEVFTGAFTEENVKYDGHLYLKAALEGDTFEADIENYRNILKENIGKYVEENNLSVNGNADEIINEFTEKAILEYEDAAKIPYISTISIFYKAVNKVFWPGCIIMLVFSALTIWILIKQNPYKKNRIFKYAAYSTASACMSLLVIPLYLQITGIYKKVQIYPEYLYRFIKKYVENGIIVMSTTGIILLITTAIMIAASSYIKYYYIHKKSNKHFK